jgi:hypothetical protein
MQLLKAYVEGVVNPAIVSFRSHLQRMLLLLLLHLAHCMIAAAARCL